MNRIIRLPLALLVASAAFAVVVGFASGWAASKTQSPATNAAAALQNAFVTVYRKVSPSVVQIETSEGLGSGIVFDAEGNIVTNAHVVGSSKTFTVTTST